MADGLDYKKGLSSLLKAGDWLLAAEGAHPGLKDPDSDFSLANLVKDKGLGTEGAPSKTLTGMDDETTEALTAAVKTSDKRASNEKSDKKKAKGKLAKAAASALGGGTLAPFVPGAYTPSTVDFTATPYTGGRPTRTQSEYAKDLA